MGFYATLMVRLGSGPAWNRVMEQPAEACRQNWFYNIIYLNNYIHNDNQVRFSSESDFVKFNYEPSKVQKRINITYLVPFLKKAFYIKRMQPAWPETSASCITLNPWVMSK